MAHRTVSFQLNDDEQRVTADALRKHIQSLTDENWKKSVYMDDIITLKDVLDTIEGRY